MNVEIKPMPEFRCAALRHVGSYQRITETFGRLHAIVAHAELFEGKPTTLASGERIGDGTSYEIYLNTPMEVPKTSLRRNSTSRSRLRSRSPGEFRPCVGHSRP